MFEGNPLWTPFGTLYDPAPPTLQRHGYTLAQVKAWREQQFNEGKPSGLEDFYSSHSVCPGCHGARRTVTGLRWRDQDYWPHTVRLLKDGPHTIASLLQNEAKDAVASDFTYEPCELCAPSKES